MGKSKLEMSLQGSRENGPTRSKTPQIMKNDLVFGLLNPVGLVEIGGAWIENGWIQVDHVMAGRIPSKTTP